MKKKPLQKSRNANSDKETELKRRDHERKDSNNDGEQQGYKTAKGTPIIQQTE